MEKPRVPLKAAMAAKTRHGEVVGSSSSGDWVGAGALSRRVGPDAYNIGTTAMSEHAAPKNSA